jgi:transcriptional regulator with XRE-family HTH domain
MTSAINHNPFGQFLQQLRKSRKAGVAPTARAAGLHRSTLHRWERGEALPRLWELDALLTTLEATPQQKKQALALMDAPRAQQQVQERINRIAESLELQSLPHGGDLLRAMRLRRGWTLEEVASQVGISDRTLRRWEAGSIWPSVPQIHALCFALKAEEEEIVALTCGHLRFSSRHEPDGPLSPEEMEAHIWAMDRRFNQGENRLAELELLTLKRQAWALATRQERGRRLLALAHYIHARYHLNRGKRNILRTVAEVHSNLVSNPSHGKVAARRP